ncbi:MAG: alanine racemase [Spirochaetia bacterium]|nr:alanine racemase [Spirochaetia bacterium]
MDGPLLVVDADAVARNFGRIRAAMPGHEVVPVLKGDAYGLGSAEIGRALTAVGARRFWVETLEEGQSLRRSLEEGQSLRLRPSRLKRAEVAIGVLDGPAPGEVALFLEHGLEAAIGDEAQAGEWRQAHGQRVPSCVLNVDTGFNRLGFRTDAPLFEDFELFESCRPRAWMTHLADGGADPDSPRNREQCEAIRRFAKRMEPVFPSGLPLSLGLDGAVALRGKVEVAEVRTGAALFGVQVFPEYLPLEGVARLDAPVLRVIEVPKGARVGYGAGWEARRPSRVAVLGIGYAHGVPRALAGTGRIGFGPESASRSAPIVGAISMELLACDVTDLPARETAPGTRGRLLDGVYGINELARDSGRLDTEILCALGRCPRTYRRSSL